MLSAPVFEQDNIENSIVKEGSAWVCHGSEGSVKKTPTEKGQKKTPISSNFNPLTPIFKIIFK